MPDPVDLATDHIEREAAAGLFLAAFVSWVTE